MHAMSCNAAFPWAKSRAGGPGARPPRLENPPTIKGFLETPMGS